MEPKTSLYFERGHGQKIIFDSARQGDFPKATDFGERNSNFPIAVRSLDIRGRFETAVVE